MCSVCVCTGTSVCVVGVFQNHGTQNISSIDYLLLRCNKKRLSSYMLERVVFHLEKPLIFSYVLLAELSLCSHVPIFVILSNNVSTCNSM